MNIFINSLDGISKKKEYFCVLKKLMNLMLCHKNNINKRDSSSRGIACGTVENQAEKKKH